MQYRTKMLQLLMQVEFDATYKPEIQAMIQRELRLILDDHRLQNLCETVANMLGKTPEG